MEITHDQVHNRESQTADHQAPTAAKLVDDLRADDRADDTDGVKSPSETGLLDGRVPCLREEHGRVRGDGLLIQSK